MNSNSGGKQQHQRHDGEAHYPSQYGRRSGEAHCDRSAEDHAQRFKRKRNNDFAARPQSLHAKPSRPVSVALDRSKVSLLLINDLDVQYGSEYGPQK